MKQHISLDDLNQLSDKGKERLREWHYGMTTKERGEIAKEIAKQNLYTRDPAKEAVDFLHTTSEIPLLSIGQLIQFLDEHGWNIMHMNKVKNDTRWWVEATSAKDGDILEHGKNVIGNTGETDKYPELCDSLWMAVKDILEKE